jgi:hypothetical protein
MEVIGKNLENHRSSKLKAGTVVVALGTESVDFRGRAKKGGDKSLGHWRRQGTGRIAEAVRLVLGRNHINRWPFMGS